MGRTRDRRSKPRLRVRTVSLNYHRQSVLFLDKEIKGLSRKPETRKLVNNSIDLRMRTAPEFYTRTTQVLFRHLSRKISRYLWKKGNSLALIIIQ